MPQSWPWGSQTTDKKMADKKIYDFCKALIFEKHRQCKPAVQGKFLISVGQTFNVIQRTAAAT